MADQPVWDQTISTDAARALDPGCPPELDTHPDVLVVGGGIIGLATAAACAGAGLGRVVLAEAGRLAGASSGRAAGVLAPEPHAWTDPASLVSFGRRSLALTRRLDADWEGAIGLQPIDCLLAGRHPEEAPLALDAPVEVLGSEALAEREPFVRGVERATLVRDQARVQPLRFAAALASRAGTVATGLAVRSPEMSGEQVVRLGTPAGAISPGAVVFATGAAPDVPGFPVAPTHVKGHLISTSPMPAGWTLGSQLVCSWGAALQLPDGGLLAGGTLDEGDEDPEVTPAAIVGIRAGLAESIVGAHALDLAHSWCCFRPTAPDRLPVVDRVPGTSNAWVSFGHYRTGLLMAVATGVALATWIASGTPPDEVAPFSLSRFA